MAEIIGTPNDDILDGTNDDDTIKGLAGDDLIDGLDGDDFLRGDDGDDVVFGNDGNDSIFAGEADDGDDLQLGGDGDDEIGGNGGDDILIGDSHDGVMDFGDASDDGNDQIYGGDGQDLLIGGSYDNDGVDVSYAGAADGAIAGNINGTGNTVAWAGDGNDIVYGAHGSDILGGGHGDDQVYGLGGDDIIFGKSGDDTLDGGDGDDLIFNGAGSDVVDGGAGDDLIWAGGGDDQLTGGAGGDTFGFDADTAGNGNDNITDFNTDEDTLLLANYGFQTKYDVIRAMADSEDGVVLTLSDDEVVTIAGTTVLQFLAAPDSAIELQEFGPGGDGGSSSVTYHTIFDQLPEGESPEEEAPEKVLMWGYTPGYAGEDHDHDHEGAHGVPVEELLSFLTTITGLDLAELGLIDDDGVGPFDNVTDISLTLGDLGTTSGGDGGNANNTNTGSGEDNDATADGASANSSVSISFADGSVVNTEAVLGGYYFDFLNNLIYDQEGNSRLFWGVPGGVDEDSSYDSGAGSDRLVLTEAQNYWGDHSDLDAPGTVEESLEPGSYTGDGDDVIVAGRLELLHQAFIEAGAGYNVLEVDAKGVYAQPLKLENIQEVHINNLPNFYSDGSGSSTSSGFPSDYPEVTGNNTYPDSFLDLSRATEVERVVITEGVDVFEGINIGQLTVAGIRNNAVARLEGGFHGGVNLHYGEGQEGGIILELNLGDTGSEFLLNVAHNSNTLTLVSMGGGNAIEEIDLGNGLLTTLNIIGDAPLYLGDDISDWFEDGRPVTVNAIENTGGVDLNINNHREVIILGSKGNDEWQIDHARSLEMVLQDGDNRVNANDVEFSSIVGGDGDNVITQVDVERNVEVSDVTLGNGDNFVAVNARQSIDISTGEGDDYIVVGGYFSDFEFGKSQTTTSDDDNGVLVNINVGGGDNTVRLGWNKDGNDKMPNLADGVNGGDVDWIDDTLHDTMDGITALPGSVIRGKDIALFVDQTSDVTQVDFSEANFSEVVLQGDAGLAVTLGQFLAIGPDKMRAEYGAFDEVANVTIVVSEDLNFDDLGDLETMIDNGVRISIFLEDGAMLTLTAEQLDKYVANDGILTDIAGLTGSVMITDAGLSFNEFGTDSSTGGVEGAEFISGTLSDDSDCGFDDGTGVTIMRTADGYERPAPTSSDDALKIDTDPGVVTISEDLITSETDTLLISGSNDLVIADGVCIELDPEATVDFSGLTGDLTGMDLLLRGASQPTIIGNADTDNRIDLKLVGVEVSHPGDNIFTAAVVGEEGYDKGINSSGVQTFVVTDVDDGEDDGNGTVDPAELLKWNTVLTDQEFATIYVCDKTEDLEVLGLQGNFNAVVNFLQVNWGVDLLLEGDGAVDHSAKANGNPAWSNIGQVNMDFFWPGAPAVVNINNQGVDLGADGRPLHVEAINITNASSITVNVEDGDAVIGSINNNSEFNGGVGVTDSGTGPHDGDASLDLPDFLGSGNEMVETLTFVSANDVTVQGGFDLAGLSTIDASAVDGTFTLMLTDMMAVNDLSDVDLIGVEAIVFGNDGTQVTVSADQIIDLGVDGFADTSVEMSMMTMLNVNGLSTQEIDFRDIDVEGIGEVAFADVDGEFTVAAGTDFDCAECLVVNAVENDTTVVLTYDQLLSADTKTPDGIVDVKVNTGITKGGDTFTGTVALTDIGEDDCVDVSQFVDGGVAEGDINVELRLVDFTASADFGVIGGSDVDLITINASGAVDLTASGSEMNGKDIDDVDCIVLEDGAVLTLTAAQVDALENGDDEIQIKLADGASATLNVTDLSTESIDLDALVEAYPGLNIGTVSILDLGDPASPGASDIVIDAATTFGGADEIVTPTADENDADDGLEPTTVTMTVQQFLSSAGIITGDSVINMTNLVNNNDSDGDFVLDEAVVDLSGVNNAGFVQLGELTVTLADGSDLGDFQIQLSNGQMIRFNAPEQADGADIVEIGGGTPVTAVAWLFESSAIQPIDTTNYNGGINHLFISEELIDNTPGQNEEAIWNTLASSIVVEKYNANDIPDIVIPFDRVNTFEALTAVNGVVYDDQDEYQTIANLTINLEGHTNIGDVGVGDTVVAAGEPSIFDTLTINSYEDRTTLGALDTGFDFLPNRVGDISLNVGTVDELLDVTINTGDFFDAVNVNGAAATRDGLDIEVGTIFFGAEEADSHALLTLTGDNDITIDDVDISDAEVSLLHIDVDEVFDGNPPAEVTIGGESLNDLADAVGLADDLDSVFHMDGFVADDTDSLGTAPWDEEIIIRTVGGDNNVKELGVGSAFEVDAVIIEPGTTLTMTAAQVAAVGIVDADGDGVADNWIGGGTLHICDLNGEDLDLDLIAAAGINIGTITIEGDGVTELHPDTTLGDADVIEIIAEDNGTPEDVTLVLTAAQFQSSSEVIIETVSGDATASVTIDQVASIGTAAEPGDPLLVDLDLSGVAVTTGTNNLFLTDDDDTNVPADVLFSDTSVLNSGDNSFAVNLWDINDDGGAVAHELDGQTVRFSNAVQAERVVNVLGADDDTNPANDLVPTDANYPMIDESEKNEKDTNVVWAFSSIVGTVEAGVVDVSGYNGNLGRLWLRDDLVDGVNVDALFTITDENGDAFFTLDADIIKRIDETDLIGLLELNVPINQTVEVSAFTQLAFGTEYTIEDLLVSVANLDISLGGETSIGDLLIDNLLAAPDPNFPNFPGDDEFGTLTINSYLADDNAHYLLPDGWDPADNPLPSNTLYFDGDNVIGDIASGPSRGELANVDIDTSAPGEIGASLVFGTMSLSDDDANSTATVDIDGNNNNDVTGKAIDTSDADVTTLVVDTTGFNGVFTLTGGSPAFDLDDTEILRLVDANGNSTVNSGYEPELDGNGNLVLNLDGNGVPYAGVAGADLSLIDTDGHDGNVNLGVIAEVDGDDFTLDNNGNANGTVTATLGDANVDGNTVAPELNDGGTWDFDDGNTNGPGMELTIQESAEFGAGNLRFNQVDVINIEGDVDFTGLLADDGNTGAVEGLEIIGDGNSNDNTQFVLAEGATLKMTDEQFIQFKDEFDITGPGTDLTVDAAFITDNGGDLTELRGLTSIDVAAGSVVTMTPEQARIATVDGGAVGDLTGIDVTIIVDDEDECGDPLGPLLDGNGNAVTDDVNGNNNAVDSYEDLTGVMGINTLIIEDSDGNPNTVDVTVGVTVEEADGLATGGTVTKNGNDLLAAAGDTDVNGNADGNFVDLTDPNALDLSLVDALLLQDEDATIVDLTQLQTLSGNGAAIIQEDADGNPNTLDNPIILKAAGDISDENLNLVDGLILTGDATVSLLQAESFGFGVVEDPADSGFTLFVDDLQFDANGNANPNVNINLTNLSSDTNANDNVSTGLSSVVLKTDAVDENANPITVEINSVAVDGNGNTVITGLMADGDGNANTVDVQIDDANLFSNPFDAFEVSGSADFDQNVNLNLNNYDFTYSGSGSYTNDETDVTGTSTWDGSGATGDVSVNLDFDDNNANQNTTDFTFTGSSGVNVVEIVDEGELSQVLGNGGTVSLTGGPGGTDEFVINDDEDVNTNPNGNLPLDAVSGFEYLVLGDLDGNEFYDLTGVDQFMALILDDANSNQNSNFNVNGIDANLAMDIRLRFNNDGFNMINALDLALEDANGNTDEVQVTFLMDGNEWDDNNQPNYMEFLTIDGVETITLVSSGDALDGNGNRTENDVYSLFADAVETLVIEGDVDFNVNTNSAPMLDTVDANGFSGGSLKFSDGNGLTIDLDYLGAASSADQDVNINSNDVGLNINTGDGEDDVNVNQFSTLASDRVEISTEAGDDLINVDLGDNNADVDVEAGADSDVVRHWRGGDDIDFDLGTGMDLFVATYDVNGNDALSGVSDLVIDGGDGNDLILINLEDGNGPATGVIALGSGADRLGLLNSLNDDGNIDDRAIGVSDFDVDDDVIILEAFDFNTNSNLMFDGNSIPADANGNNIQVTDDVTFVTQSFPSGAGYDISGASVAGTTLIVEFSFDANNNADDWDANFPDGEDLLRGLDSNGNNTDITVTADQSGYIVAYNSGDAWIWAYEDADGNGDVDSNEVELVTRLEDINIGALDGDNFDEMFL
ncbi:calcium-binding protein [Shimia abyssi]|uniref:Ca2+-binding RTX toxin-like protein n=1 Tax=Shimia abyssi TaxID=1662395 RepID=A0A2P8F7B3_9RHOB|nr:calcium-binding protein [Shimia abyssi]PSL17572.1 hypothetical protein CLV88_11619 [Shimia abyssi]